MRSDRRRTYYIRVAGLLASWVRHGSTACKQNMLRQHGRSYYHLWCATDVLVTQSRNVNLIGTTTSWVSHGYTYLLHISIECTGSSKPAPVLSTKT